MGLEGVVQVYTYAISPPSWIKPYVFAGIAFVTYAGRGVIKLIEVLRGSKDKD